MFSQDLERRLALQEQDMVIVKSVKSEVAKVPDLEKEIKFLRDDNTFLRSNALLKFFYAIYVIDWACVILGIFELYTTCSGLYLASQSLLPVMPPRHHNRRGVTIEYLSDKNAEIEQVLRVYMRLQLYLGCYYRIMSLISQDSS